MLLGRIRPMSKAIEYNVYLKNVKRVISFLFVQIIKMLTDLNQLEKELETLNTREVRVFSFLRINPHLYSIKGSSE